MRSLFLLLVISAVATKVLAQDTDAPATIGDFCQSSRDCGDGLDCELRRCVNKGCMTRELHDLSLEFDGSAFRDQLLAEAGVTQQDLFVARQEHRFDNNAFVSSPAVKAFLSTIRAHEGELLEVAEVLHSCATEDPSTAGELEGVDATEEKDLGRGIGKRVGNFLGTIQHFFSGDGRRMLEDEALAEVVEHAQNERRLQTAPTSAPSNVPSSAPTFNLNTKTNLGFHIEGGVVFDGSCSILYPSNATYDVPSDPSNIYSRTCIGAELGLGAEVSLIIQIVNSRNNNDIIGPSLLFETDAAGGPALGFGIGVYIGGAMTNNGNQALHYEVTIGAGLGVGVFGASICRTDYCYGV